MTIESKIKPMDGGAMDSLINITEKCPKTPLSDWLLTE